MSNGLIISQPDKFKQTLTELFGAMEIVIGDLNMAGKTSLTVDNVTLVRVFVMGMDKGHLTNKFIENSEPYWDNILNKEDDFFVNNSAQIFGKYASAPEFNALKVIFGKNKDGVGLVDDQTKDDVRDFLNSLVKISIVHIFNSRVPKVEKNGSKVSISYGKKTEYPNIDVIGHSKKWKVALW